MKLLLDENLSRKLVPFLQEDYPGSSHVVFLGLERQADRRIWDYAKANDFVIVTSDSDFHDACRLPAENHLAEIRQPLQGRHPELAVAARKIDRKTADR